MNKHEASQPIGASKTPINPQQMIPAEANNQSTALTAQSPGSELAVYDYGTDAGKGLENISRDEYAIPFVYVLDAKSPQCSPPSAGGIPGAKAGALYNTATGELYDGEKGALFIPVHRAEEYGEWIPRRQDGSGGGFVGVRSANDPLVLELQAKHGMFGKLPTSDGHELVQTYKLYGMLVGDDGVGSPALVPFKSTGIGAYKNFITRVMSIQYQVEKSSRHPTGLVRPPMWAHRWRLGTRYRPAKQPGQSGWYIPRLWLDEEPPLRSRLKTNEPLYIQGAELSMAITQGRVTVKAEQEQRTADQEVPF